jgi:DNA recombination protein RmuC
MIELLLGGLTLLAVVSVAVSAYLVAQNKSLRHEFEKQANELAQATTQRDGLRESLVREEREKLLALQQLEIIKERTADLEQIKAATVAAAKAATFETATTATSKLLEDHKREAESQRDQNNALLKTTTDDLVEKVLNVSNVVKVLESRVAETSETTEALHKALANPSYTGRFTEIGLENTLRSFGLERDRDFLIQQSITDQQTGTRIRPDAIVFLPRDVLLVIDAKASKFLLELAQAEGTDDEDRASAKFVSAMNGHLRSLTSKDYESTIKAAYRAVGKTAEITRIFTVMYLATESAVERINQLDSLFFQRAAEANITVTGPGGLASYISISKTMIDDVRRAENHQTILARTQAVLESVVMALAHAGQVGRNLQNASDAYKKFSGSVNRYLVPRSRELARLGVRPSGNKPLPSPLPLFDVVASSENVLEGQVETTTQLTDRNPEDDELPF